MFGDTSALITVIPTIMQHINSRVFVVCIVVLGIVSKFGRGLDSTWDWKLTRAIAKYELQNLRRGLYELSNIDVWKKEMPQLTQLFSSFHQIRRIQVLVTKIQHGIVYRGKENISGKRYILRVDSDSMSAVHAVEYLNTYERKIDLSKDLTLSLSPYNTHTVHVTRHKANALTRLLIVDTY